MKKNIIELEEELTNFHNDGLTEEKILVKNNYAAIDNDLRKLKASIPFPNITQYSTETGYDEIDDLQY